MPKIGNNFYQNNSSPTLPKYEYILNMYKEYIETA